MMISIKKKNILIFALAIAVLTVLTAGAVFASDFPEKIAITYVKAPLNVPSIVAKDLKIYEEAFPGVSMTFPEITQGPEAVTGTCFRRNRSSKLHRSHFCHSCGHRKASM